MYSESEGSRKTIGDVDVLFHDGVYHLFHLVLPNHDYIAHAVSTNGINWRRVNNALFIGDPGSWDDLMLWTVHVSPDPHSVGRWRMFYTGLSRREQGKVQRVGLATSNDLFHWKKAPVRWRDARGQRDPEAIRRAADASRRTSADEHASDYDVDSCFPLEADGEYYEASVDEGRRFISFRDPFYFHGDDQGWLLLSARTRQGPIIRRGCVGTFKETRRDCFSPMPPLYFPQLYDDIEVPSLFKLEDEYYLIGSIREDAKIRYWHTNKLGEPWKSYHDNVLMAKGNYAGRVSRDDRGWLIWNFFVMDDAGDRTSSNVMPPPKRLVRTEEGQLRVRTFDELEESWLSDRLEITSVKPLKDCSQRQRCVASGDSLEAESLSSFQAFTLEDTVNSFRLQANMKLHGRGKCGLVFRVDPETHDGYYLSLDMLKGVAQLRSWRTGAADAGEQMMQFETLQQGFWHSKCADEARVKLIAFGSYIEFSVNDYVLLSLVDPTFRHGLLGVYVETAHIELSQVEIHRMRPPGQSDEHLIVG